MEKVKEAGSVLGLERMELLCEIMGNPQNQIPLIHIAGTNGKGSVGAMLEAGLIACGLKVGKYSSPAVFHYEEIIQLNGKAIETGQLENLFEELYQRWEEAGNQDVPTLFELETAAAFWYFQQENCQVGIIETGLGGRMDATNVIAQPLLSVITSISMDHCQILGDTIEKIAFQKAGIMKENGRVVSSLQRSEVMNVLLQEATLKNSILKIADMENLRIRSHTLNGIGFDCKTGEKWLENNCLSLTGKAQEENLCLVVAIFEKIQEKFSLQASVFFDALKSVHHPGRFQKLLDRPTVIIDGAHNPDAAKKLRNSLIELFPDKKFRFVIGVFKDKDYQEELKLLLPLAQKVYTIKPNQSRGLDAEELKKVSLQYCPNVENCGCESRGIQRALDDADGEDCIVVCGSLSILREAQKAIQQANRK